MGEGEASAMEMGEGESGEKFRRWRWVRNFGDGDEASEMREQMKKIRNREGRRRRDRTECVDEREVSGENTIKYIYIFFYNTCYSAILCLELYCSSIAKKFAILLFTIL